MSGKKTLFKFDLNEEKIISNHCSFCNEEKIDCADIKLEGYLNKIDAENFNDFLEKEGMV